MTSFGLLFTSWVMPSHFLPWVSWHNEVLAFLSVLVLAFGLARASLKDTAKPWLEIPGAALPFLGLGVVLVIQGGTGLLTFWGDVLVLEFYLALTVVALASGFNLAQANQPLVQAALRPKAIDPLLAMAWTLVAGAIASSITALVQVFEVWESASWIVRMGVARRPGANLGQPNQLGTLLLMGLASLLYLWERRRLSGGTAALIYCLLAVGLAATESRAAVLGFLLLCVWWIAGRSRAGLRLSPWAVGVGVGLFLSLFLAWPSLMSATSESFGPEAQVNTKPGMRLVVWPQLLKALAISPWWGWGLREVSEAHNAVASGYLLSEPFTYSHNIGLDLALGVGVPLAVLFIVLACVWLWRRIRATRTLTPWYCLAAALPVAVHSMLEFPFAYAYFLAPVMFLLGVLEAATGAKAVLRVQAKAALAGLVLVSVVGASSVVEYLRIEEDFRIARFEALRVGRTPGDYKRPEIFLLTQLNALLHGARIAPHPGMSPDEVELARKVALRYPWPATQNRYALSLALNGNPSEALRQLQVLRALHGEKTYQEIKVNWNSLAQDKYPQLRELTLP